MKTVRAFLFSVMCLAPALPLLGDVRKAGADLACRHARDR